MKESDNERAAGQELEKDSIGINRTETTRHTNSSYNEPITIFNCTMRKKRMY